MDAATTPDLDEILNHCRIHQFLNKATEKLHQIFRNRWKIYQEHRYPKNPKNGNGRKIQWNNKNNQECGKILLQLCSSFVGPEFEETLKTGKIDLWDITLTKIAIQGVSKALRNYGVFTDKKEDQFINDLNKIRNAVAHGKCKLSDDEYSIYCDQIKDALIKAGEDPAEIEEFRKSLMEFGQQKISEIVDEKSKFAQLKEEANKLFKAKKFTEAIEKYSEALEISGISPENHAIIYSNRSLARLKLGTSDSLLMAKRDAEWSIQLWPCYWRGYFNLAKIEIKLENWGESQKSLDKALALNPASKEIRDERSMVRSQIGIMSGHNHINPALQPQTPEEITKDISSRLGVSEKQAQKLLNRVANSSDNIIKGNQYKNGEAGVPQDFAKAAACYAKAAAENQPLGMFYLGEMYYHGKGVNRDYEKAIFWLKKAANAKEPQAQIMIGSGIPEAQYTLGFAYMDGIGVTKDLNQAVEWYEKAVMNGNSGAANNLGMLYSNGKGVEKSQTKAFHYFKMAAQFGDTTGMQNLAQCYFNSHGSEALVPTEEDISEGMKWLRIAASKGDILAIQELDRREKVSPKQHEDEAVDKLLKIREVGKNDPLDQEQFGKVIKEMAKNGSKAAQKLVVIWKLMDAAMDAFKSGNHAEVISSLAKAIRLDNQMVKIPELLKPVIKKNFKTHPNDLNTIICYIQSNATMSVLNNIDKYLKMFPNDEYLLDMRLAGFLTNKEMEKALNFIDDKILKIYPNSLRFLYLRAITIGTQENQTLEIIKAYDAFLAVAPIDDEKVPMCHYRKATFYLSTTKEFEKFIKSFEAGIESEKHQLPCFLPYEYGTKDFLEKMYMHLKSQMPQKVLENLPVPNSCKKINNQKVLLNPRRKLLIIKHREMFAKYSEAKFKSGIPLAKPHKTPQPPTSLANLKPITLKDMDPTKEKIYNGFVLEAKIIDWAINLPGIATIIEDRNGDVERLAIYNWPKASDEMEVMKTFRPNCLVSIINPYLRQAMDYQNVIRGENPEYINIDNSVAEKQCHCCGKEAKLMKCGKCLIARYCSKECQKVDWNEFNHKKVCKHLKNYFNLL